jgi:predicted RND superfamily exporter protein
VASGIDGFLSRFETMTLVDQAKYLMDFQMRMTGALLGQFQALHAATDTAQLTWNDLPSQLQGRFVSPAGRWLLQIFPKEQVWDHDPLERFVKDVRSVDPEVTGTPLQNYEASRQIRSSYTDAAMYAFAAILLVLMIDFLGRGQKLLVLGPPLAVVLFAWMMLQTRRIEVSPVLMIGSYLIMTLASAAILDTKNLRDTLLAMSPPLIGSIMSFGIMGLLGVDLNPANLIALPLVLGIGVDDGVHLVHDFRAKTGRRYEMSASTMNAIVLTSLTTIGGFGSMMIAAHRGLASLGLVMSVGVGSCLFVSLVPLPAMLTLLSSGGSSASAARGAGGGTADDEDPRILAARQGKGQPQPGKRRAA